MHDLPLSPRYFPHILLDYFCGKIATLFGQGNLNITLANVNTHVNIQPMYQIYYTEQLQHNKKWNISR